MNSVFRFYRKVYNQELNQSKRLHLHSGRILKNYFISNKEELLNGEYPLIPIDDKKGEEIFKILELKGSEIELKYYSLLRISRFTSLNKYQTSRAYPLFEFKASIESNENGYFLSGELNSGKIIKSNLPSSITSDNQLKKIMTSEIIDVHFVSQFHSILQKHMDGVQADELLMFPDLYDKRKVNKLLKADFKEEEIFIPAGILAIVERENDSYTTLDELKVLEKEGSFSAPLEIIFDGQENSNPEKTGIICEELNRSQIDALSNGNDKIISVISGPPGTGKSYTIANIAAEKVSKGQSVLITSKNKEALSVIDDKINDQLGIEGLCINPTEDNQLLVLKKHLDFLLSRKYKPKNKSMNQIEAYYGRFQNIHDSLNLLQKDLIKHLELEKNYITRSFDSGLGARLTSEIKNRIIKSRGKITIPLWEKLEAYYSGLESERNYAVQLIKEVNHFMIDKSVSKHRLELRDYLAFLRARDPNWKKDKEGDVDFDVVLRTFPVWLVKANEISRVLAFNKEMFDVLIIDEASQCDIPSLLPLMQRAKKCIIVGDVHQLSHVSFIPKSFESANRREVVADKQHLCQHRDNSVLDLVSELVDPMDITQLNEHFRSQFPIISFSNQQFYDSNLNILTKRPLSTSRHIEFIKTKGKRINNYNLQEVDKIIKKIRDTISKEKDLPTHLKSSIGVLSPFRKQVDKLFNEIRKNLTIDEIKKHQILVGTAFSFQGNERDMMLLSFCLDNKSLGGSFTFLNRNDVFNVSVTRARSSQFIYYSFDEHSVNENSTIADFFRYYNIELKNDKGSDSKDQFCLEVESELKKKKLNTWKEFEISGTNIDLLTNLGNEYVGIDLIGFPGEMEDYYSLERYKMLRRGKVKLFPLSYPLWIANRDQCIQAIINLFDKKE